MKGCKNSVQKGNLEPKERDTKKYVPFGHKIKHLFAIKQTEGIEKQRGKRETTHSKNLGKVFSGQQ